MAYEFFSAVNAAYGTDPGHARDLFITDGTAAGTHSLGDQLVSDILAVNGHAIVARPSALDSFNADGFGEVGVVPANVTLVSYTATSNEIYFIGYQTVSGKDIYSVYSSDGTQSGTRALMQVPGTTSLSAFALDGSDYIEFLEPGQSHTLYNVNGGG